MKYIVSGIAMLYALLSAAAALSQIKGTSRKDAPALMLSGGVVLAAGAVLQLAGWNLDWAVAIAGGALICLAAFLNGKRSGAFHPHHHIIRLLVTLAIAAGLFYQ